MDRRNKIETIIPPRFSAEEWQFVVKYYKLSPQQANIVALIMHAQEDKQIERRLTITNHTLRDHVRIIFPRMRAEGRVEVVLRAFEARDMFREHQPALLPACA